MTRSCTVKIKNTLGSCAILSAPVIVIGLLVLLLGSSSSREKEWLTIVILITTSILTSSGTGAIAIETAQSPRPGKPKMDAFWAGLLISWGLLVLCLIRLPELPSGQSAWEAVFSVVALCLLFLGVVVSTIATFYVLWLWRKEA